MQAVGGQGLASAVGLQEGSRHAGGADGVGGASDAVCLAAVALPCAEVVAGIASGALRVVAIAIVAVSWLAEQASGGHSSVGRRAALAGADAGLALVAVQILALDALVVDELVSVLAGKALACGRVARAASHIAKHADVGGREGVIASGCGEVAGTAFPG